MTHHSRGTFELEGFSHTIDLVCFYIPKNNKKFQQNQEYPFNLFVKIGFFSVILVKLMGLVQHPEILVVQIHGLILHAKQVELVYSTSHVTDKLLLQ